MKTVKSLFTKILVTSMIIAMFSTSLLQNTASASTTVTVDQSLLNQNDRVTVTTDDQILRAGLPPRKPTNDPFWTTFSLIIAGFVGIQTAQTITQNAINNGIDYACNRWKKTPGVKQACKWAKNN